jgi:hypothetical protein
MINLILQNQDNEQLPILVSILIAVVYLFIMKKITK